MLAKSLLGPLEAVNRHWVEADRRVGPAAWTRTRILSLALLLVGPHIPRLGAVADLPEELLDAKWRFPAGFLGVAPAPVLLTISLATAIYAAIALSGLRVRSFGVATAILLVVGNSVLYTVGGKIVHHQWTAIAIAVFSATLWSGKDTVFGKWSPRLVVAWILGWGLMTSALAKIRGGWLDPSTSVVRVELDLQAAAQGFFAPGNQLGIDFAGSSLLWELADYSTVVLEAGLVVAVVRPSLFRWAIVVLVGFHISIFVFLGISFVAVLPAYIPFMAEFLPRSSSRFAYSGWVAAALGAFTCALILRSHPDGTVWLMDLLGVPLENPAGVTLLIVPIMLVWCLVRSTLRSPVTTPPESSF